MRAIVTGAAGFIGSNLSDRLLSLGYEVVGVDNLTDYYDSNIKRRNIKQSLEQFNSYTFIEADIRHVVTASMLDGVDVVFHQAGQPGVRSSWRNGFEDYVELNVLATQDLLEKMVRSGRPKVVIASSSSVYGNAKIYPITEEDETRPFSPYGVTKLAAERLAIAYAENFDLSVAALRYFTVYGPRQRPDMAIGRMVYAALTRSLFPIYGDGSNLRDFTFIDDVVEANVLAGVERLDKAQS